MTFKTTLFKALDAAQEIIIDGMEVEDGYNERNGTRRYDLADESRRIFTDQEITVDDDGDATAMACDTDEQGQAYCDAGICSISFHMTRGLAEGDVQ